MDFVSCWAYAKPAINFLLKVCILSISFLKDQSFRLSYPRADDDEAFSLRSTFTFYIQVNNSWQSLVQCGRICSVFQAILMSMALSCVKRSILSFIQSLSFLHLESSCTRDWFFISIQILEFLQYFAISLIRTISRFSVLSSLSQFYIRFSSSFSFQESCSLMGIDTAWSYLVRVSTYAANLSINFECFSPIAPEWGVTRWSVIFFVCNLLIEEVFCMGYVQIFPNAVQYYSSIAIPTMIDFSKLYCKAHPYEPINNFCSDKDCLVGLCATCICQHTEMHMQNHTTPQYENIRSTFSRVHEEIQTQIDVISTDKERLGNLLGSIREKKENFKSVLQKSRNDCLQLVKEHFDQLERTWEADIANEEKRHTLHNTYRLDTLSALISKEITGLIDQSRRMNSVTFVEEIPRIVKETLVESRAFHARVSEQFEDNEKYTPIVSYCPQRLKEVGESLKKLLSLEFSIPIKKYVASTNSQLLNRVNLSFRSETPKKQPSLPVHSLVIKRTSAQKTSIPLSQSSLYSVPMVLTTSYLNINPQRSQLMSNQSQVIQKSRMSKINFTPNYVDKVEINKLAKNQSKTQLKHKKSGLSLLGNYSEVDSVACEKENAKK